MEDFDQQVTRVLTARPGITKAKLAAAMELEFDDKFRESLDKAYDKGIIHRVQDKYYPGSASHY